jgi:hypothetical protein
MGQRSSTTAGSRSAHRRALSNDEPSTAVWSTDLERLTVSLAELRAQADGAARAAEQAARPSTLPAPSVTPLRRASADGGGGNGRLVRETEAATREASWHAAQQQRLDADVARLRDALPRDRSRPTRRATPLKTRPRFATWEARRGRAPRATGSYGGPTRRDTTAPAGCRTWPTRVRPLCPWRGTHRPADRESATLVESEAALRAERDRLGTDIAVAATRERDAREALAALHSAECGRRSRLAEAEREASAARERLRTADDRVRARDHTELEARLGLESLARTACSSSLRGLATSALPASGSSGRASVR